MLWTLDTRIDAPGEWHTHAVFELVLCRADVGCLALDRDEIALRRGRAILLAPHVRHRYDVPAGKVAEVKVVCLTPADIAAFLSPATVAAIDAVRARGSVHADATGACTRVIDTAVLIEPGLGTLNGASLRLAWGAIGLLLAWLCEPLQGAAPNHARDARFEPVREWIDAHLDDPVSLDALAARFGMSRSLLSRGFRGHTGQSVVEYATTRRLERSARRLAGSDHAVAEIARDSGFGNLSHFHRQFKAFYGLTPAAFRRLASA